jgi:prepilin-type N-terminal cleavage/methylation domain-containing protein
MQVPSRKVVLHWSSNRPRRTPEVRGGFTIIDLMITITILGILAALTIPLFNRYSDRAAETAANTTHRSVRTAADMYRHSQGLWPVEFTADMFEAGQVPEMPVGYRLTFNTETGDITVETPEDAHPAVSDPWIVVADATE